MAGNVLIGRDHDLDAVDVRRLEEERRQASGGAGAKRPLCMVTLRELERGGVAVACATLFVGTGTYDDEGLPVYREDPSESARRQLDVYLGWEADGKARIIRSRADLAAHLEAWERDAKLGVVVLIEGGDSIKAPDDLPNWFEAGVRIVGPAWSGTRYCGGTRRPGPLTPAGRELVVAMRELGVVLDASHLAEQSFWDAIEIGPGRIIASHSNARALVPGDRHLTDDMIKAVAELDGVIGLNMFNRFLVPDWEPGVEVTLEHVRKHAEHMASIAGWQRIGIGSDLDGGLGLDESPAELLTAADIGRVADVAPPEHREGVAGGNWLRLLGEALP
jgi:membrane dipeptidase